MTKNGDSALQNELNYVFTIDCDDIYLREFTIGDVDDIYSISNQPEVSKYLPDWKSTRENRLDWVTNYEIPDNKKFLEAASGTPKIEEHFLKLGIILKDTDEFIGWCCTGIKDELPSPNREIMYAVSKHFQNKGYATKAAKGLISYLFNKTNVEVLNTVALTENQSSNKVIEKCGFSFIGNVNIDGELYNHYKLTKNEW
ncbi:N-acetyltransferase [Bacillus pseudomycoides]|uniref:GNAT family N-acetyltransferase n=1 Tax=Bacillus TaxID=1386 RepID=UPI0003809BEE|nr:MULTISPECIES: GNAT family N-acetyltransferase [Bacillus]PDX99219.1 N-acetyltransferase [Bacillus pseudomycoides]PEK80733.1 N-acetyltransferase [Bacillus pseudomycoides]PEN08123.1 N-acetyltransferase [Bacillus pseudomycoides]PGB87534.1 N-acetyltransferase [Bacillus pseudomycoides]PGS04538.1 N-acetyltransferase [Bacillus pseudomycoides]